MVKEEIKSGKLLLAEPFMLDSNFKRAAILLTEHNEEGSVGFILNKPLEVRVNDLVDGFPDFEADFFFGGPVQTDTLHYIHNVGDLLEDSVEVVKGVYWGGDFEKLKFLISSKLIQPHNIRFFVGYTGWSEGQLDDELVFGSWVMANMDSNYLFKSRPEKLWKKIMYNKGDSYSVIANMPEFVSWN